jgi:iron complex outermembrane receptor protein
MNKSIMLLGTALAGSLTGMPTAAFAQETAAPEQGLQDIVVTARRREESLQTTPIAVTALGAEAIVRSQIVNISDVQRTAPGLVIATGSPGAATFAYVSIRGQGNLQPILANDPAVATYIDGVYISRPSQGLTDLNDLQRLEVLRGPQGTLFGRNTTGGALNILSNDPVDRLEATFRGEVGNHGYKRVNAIINVPLAPNLNARLTYNLSDKNGFSRNVPTGRNILNQRSDFVRGKLKYEGEGFDIVLSGDYNKIKGHEQLIHMAAYNPAVLAGPLAAFLPQVTPFIHDKSRWYSTYGAGPSVPNAASNPYYASQPDAVKQMYTQDPFDTLKAGGASATINVDAGPVALKSITAFRYSKNYGLVDTDGIPAPILSTFTGSRSKAWSQELQASGDISDSLSYIAGGYISRETGYELSRSQVFGGLIRDSNADAENITKGLYAQAYYKFSDTLRATGGFRYTWDTRNTVLHNMQILGIPANAPVAGTPFGVNCNLDKPDAPATATECNQTQKAKFHYPAWTAGLDWQASDDVFVYAVTRGAAKAGGWNLRAGPAAPAFAPEKVKDVEGGIKATFLDKRLRTNLALFHTWKTGVQAVVNAVGPAGVTQYLQNNGNARIWGAELEITAVPWEGMEITASGNLSDGKYEKGTFKEVQAINGVTGTPPQGCVRGASASQVLCTVDLSNLPLIQLPKKQFNIGATQTLVLSTGELSINASYAYVSGQQFFASRPADAQSDAVKAQYAAENRLGRIPGYGLVNGRIAYKLESPDIEVSIFARNLANKKFLTRRFSDVYRSLGIATEFAGESRTWGLGLMWRFGRN